MGIAAGVVGTWVMERFQAAMSRAEESLDVGEDEESSAEGGGEEVEVAAEEADEGRLDDISLIGPYHREDESAPATAARVLHYAVTGREPDEERRRELADRLHWAQGMAMGSLYGLVRGNRRNGVDLTGGLTFGAAVWLAADEVAVPVLGLSEGPGAQPARVHLEGLAAHLVYGAATAAAHQILSRVV